ncbi:MAG: Tm-1-like ATP-binding domain-containing protein [Deltaproteobacteria bacterium]|nr:Tm-1-like ATP-binding domain-containing protein [Deltaproteobacteria bacterium]
MVVNKTILCIGTLDTKGPEFQYLSHLIQERGCKVLVMDISCSGHPFFTPDISAIQVSEAAGYKIEEVRGFKEAGPAAEIMALGARRVVKDLYEAGRFQGIISMGGGMGNFLVSNAMKELPLGFPKLMLSTQKIVQAGIKGYVGSKDIAIMPSVADIAGLNRFTKRSISNAAGAIVGMLVNTEPEVIEAPLMFMSMHGATTGCGLKVRSLVENAGYEVVVFHAIGVGGDTLEEAISSYPVKGVVELALSEIGNHLFGGLASSGPNRLEAAGKKGIPQVVAIGAFSFIQFLSPETVPHKYKKRQICYHNPQSTLVRLNKKELSIFADTVAGKLNIANGPVKVLIPLYGSSSLEHQDSIYYDAISDEKFINSLKKRLKKSIDVIEVDAHIDDGKFAKALADEFLDVTKDY